MAGYIPPTTGVQNTVNNLQMQREIPVFPVNGEMGAMSYPVGAGNTVFLIDFSSKKFWIKETSTNGFTQSLRTFSFEEILPKRDEAESEEVKQLKAQVDGLQATINELVKSLNGGAKNEQIAGQS